MERRRSGASKEMSRIVCHPFCTVRTFATRHSKHRSPADLLDWEARRDASCHTEESLRAMEEAAKR